MLFDHVHILLHSWTSVAMRRIVLPVSHTLLYRFPSWGLCLFMYACAVPGKEKYILSFCAFFLKNL